MLPPDYVVSPPLRGEVHADHFHGMSWALVASTAEIKKDSSFLMEPSNRPPPPPAHVETTPRDGASASRDASSSTLIILDDVGDDDKANESNFDWSD